MAAVALDVNRDSSPGILPRGGKLRVGLFADGRLQPRWIVEAFDKIARSDFAELAFITWGERQDHAPPLWKLYAALDRRVFGGDPSELVDLARLNRGRGPGAVHRELDVAFAIGAVDDAQLFGHARYGVWRFCFGTERGHAEALAGWRELAAGRSLTGSGIEVRLGKGAPVRLAYQGWSRTHPLSGARTRGRLLHKTAEFAWRALRELHTAGPAYLEQCEPVPEAANAWLAPSNAELIKALPGIGSRIVQRGVHKALSVDQWSLAWRFGSQKITPDLQGFVRAIPPRDREWADPFAVEKNGRYFVFFEEMPFAARKAHISMIEVKRDGSWSAPVRVLERDHHLSYPFLIEDGGELYMIPESEANRSVQVYRCVDFPLRWKLVRTLFDGVRLVDATFHHGPDHWWMFANAGAGGGEALDDELHLFHAGTLLGAWRPHRRNPVKSDARSARPAGQLFSVGGVLHRPSQICVPHYGSGLSINRVLRLTSEEYAEEPVEQVVPAAGLLGMHTVNRVGELTVVDAFSRRHRFA